MDIPNDIPIVDVPGSRDWVSGYDWAYDLEGRFPGQDAHDLGSAITYNDSGPVYHAGNVTSLVMAQQGENDGGDWIWYLEFADGSTWQARGGCDYTGWDCQSYLRWSHLS